MSSIEKLKSKAAQTSFDKKVLSSIQHIFPYVKHRLIIGESKRILPKNMYTSHDIIDDGIAELYQGGYNIDSESLAVKLKLFKIIDKNLDAILKKEAFHQKTISTDQILKNELDRLNEDFTMDADLDLILNTELDDISYHQTDPENLLIYEDRDATILKAFENEDLSQVNTSQLLGKFYSWLPINVSNIIDLYTFGKLDFEDIAKIKNIELERIHHIFDEVRKRFRRHLN